MATGFFYCHNKDEVNAEPKGAVMYINYNPNPEHSRVGDCTIRAISKALGKSWQDTYIELAIQGLNMHDMPSSNRVWSEYLYKHGFRRFIIPDSCPDCYTIKDFLQENKKGKYILSTGDHLVFAQDGNYFDTWDSGDEIPIYYFKKGE